MIELKDFIQESISINEAAPKFTNDMEGVQSFCEYVFDSKFVEWTVNPDLTISVKPLTKSPNIVMHTQDLKEIPKFIVFNAQSFIDNQVSLNLSMDSKVQHWVPRANGPVTGIVVDNNSKLKSIDMSEWIIDKGSVYVEMTSVESITNISCNSNIYFYIRKNKNLSTLTFGHINQTETKHCGYICNNKRLDAQKIKNMPKGITIEKNLNKEKLYIS